MIFLTLFCEHLDHYGYQLITFHNVIASGVLLVNGKQQRTAKQDVLSGPAGDIHKPEAETPALTLHK